MSTNADAVHMSTNADAVHMCISTVHMCRVSTDADADAVQMCISTVHMCMMQISGTKLSCPTITKTFQSWIIKH